jgi:uncharacterized protein (UPF0264 family)
LVAVAYADWQRAGAPSYHDVFDFAVAHSWGALLVDTWQKEGTTLLDWIPLAEIFGLCRRGRESGLPVALAGSIGIREIGLLLPAEPAWFAVRGSVCRGGRRNAGISARRVRQVAKFLHDPPAQRRRTPRRCSKPLEEPRSRIATGGFP